MPIAWVPGGRLVDPARGTFVARWLDHEDPDWTLIEYDWFVGIAPAIAWAQERAEDVTIVLGSPEYDPTRPEDVPAGFYSAGRSLDVGPVVVPEWTGTVEPPAEGWYQSSPKSIADHQRLLERHHGPRAGLPRPDGDPRLSGAPSPSDRLQATFKCEDEAEDGESVGPLIVFDPDAGDVIWESADWLTLSEARAFSTARNWRFSIDE